MACKGRGRHRLGLRERGDRPVVVDRAADSHRTIDLGADRPDCAVDAAAGTPREVTDPDRILSAAVALCMARLEITSLRLYPHQLGYGRGVRIVRDGQSALVQWIDDTGS